MIIEFVIIAALMLLFAVAIIILPILGKSSASVDTEGERKATNIASFKQRLSELKLDRDEQRLSQDDYERLESELKLLLLEDTEGSVKRVANYGVSNKPIVISALLLTLLAVFVYSKVGAIEDVVVAQEWQQLSEAGNSGKASPEQLQLMTRKLTNKLVDSDNPGNLYLLASLRMSEKKYVEAAATFKKLVKLMPNDMSFAAEYVQAEYLANDRKIDSRLNSVIGRILAVDPNQPTLLALVAMDAYTAGNHTKALSYWKRLQRVTPPNTKNGQVLADTIRHVEALEKKAGRTVAETSEHGAVKVEEKSAVAASSITVSVALADGVKAAPGDTVFIYVRAVGGPKMPLAIHRTTVSSLPLTVTLDDSMSMMAGMNISSFAQVEVVARISKSGQVSPSAGDWQAISQPVATKQADKVALVIDQQL